MNSGQWNFFFLFQCQTDADTLIAAAKTQNAEHVLRHVQLQDPASYEIKLVLT